MANTIMAHLEHDQTLDVSVRRVWGEQDPDTTESISISIDRLDITIFVRPEQRIEIARILLDYLA